MIKGAIFDADGTLLESMGMWDTVGQRYLEGLGIAAEPGLRQILFPLSLAECAVYLKERYGLWQSHQQIEDGINQVIHRFYCQEVTRKKGTLSFLRQLKGKGVKLTLATATDRAAIVAGLRRTDLLPLFDGIYTCGELKVDKRHPDIFDYARNQMGTQTRETWVFEDAVHAAETAYRAGYWVAGVADAYSDQQALRKVSHLYLPDLTDFPGFYETVQKRQ